MDTVIVASSQFHSHYLKRIPKGTVNAEHVEIRLDSEWDGLTARIHWLNVASNVERKPLLERDQPNTIPWEVLDDLGELRMGLVGLDGETVIKPTIWLTYGYVVDGVDPESGSDPQPPTPSWEQQMVEQATQANQAAQAAQKAAEEAAESVASAGPYAEKAKEAAEAAKASEEAAATSAQQANAAAQTAQEAAGSIGNAVEQAQSAATAAGAAQQAAEAAQTAAAQSAGEAQTAAGTAAEASLAAQGAAKAAGGYLDSVKADAQAAIEAKTQAQTAATQAGTAKDGAETAANNAEEYAKQALASVLPNVADIPDGYVLFARGGIPVWGKISSCGREPDELLNITVEDNSIAFYRVDAIGYKEFSVLIIFKPDEEITTGINGGIALNAAGSPWEGKYRIDPNIQNLPFSPSAVAKAILYRFSVDAGYMVPIISLASGNTAASAYSLYGQITPGFRLDKENESLKPFPEEVQSISVGSYMNYFGRGSKILILGWK